MLNIKIIITFLLIFSFSVVSYSDINSDLNTRKKELSSLQSNLSSKKTEKDRLVKEEKKVQQELKNISKSIEKNEKELSYLKNKIKSVEEKLSIASNEYNQADIQKKETNQIVNEEYINYSRKKMTNYFEYPLDLKVRQISITHQMEIYNDAKNKGIIAQTDIGKYTQTKQEYIDLTKKQQDLMLKNKELQKNKNKLLKTTAGKRIKAEQDIKELNNSARALEALVKKLTKAKNNADKTRNLREAKPKTRRNNLPWPVKGSIVLNYGKNKHPDLNTNVISNGIKIKAQNNAIIKAVDAGEVVFVGEFRSYGKMIIVNHKDIFFSVYGQLNNITVKQGQKVVKGGQVATVGSGESSVLYFEIRQYNVPEDPLLWLEERK